MPGDIRDLNINEIIEEMELWHGAESTHDNAECSNP